MSWSYLSFLLLVPLAFLAWYSRRGAITALSALLPTYLLRSVIFGIPTTWLELAIYITFFIALYKGDFSFLNSCFIKKYWPWATPIILWLLVAILSTIIAPDKRLALGILKGWIFDPIIFGLLVTSLFINETQIKNLWRDLLWFLLLGASLTVLFSVYLDYLSGLSRLTGWYDSPNVLAMYLTPIAFASVLWLSSAEGNILSRTKKILWLLCCAILIVGIILTGSNAGLLSLVLAFLVSYVLRVISWQKFAIVIGVIISTVGLILPWLGAFYAPSIVGSHFNTEYKINSGEVRFILWREATAMVKSHPILGVGLGQWQPNFKPLIKPDLQGVVNPGYLVELYYASLFPHNLWLTTWLSLGLFGVVILLWLVILVFGAVKPKSDWNYLIPIGILTTILLHGLVDTPLYKNDLAILFWLAIFATAITASKPNQETKTIKI